ADRSGVTARDSPGVVYDVIKLSRSDQRVPGSAGLTAATSIPLESPHELARSHHGRPEGARGKARDQGDPDRRRVPDGTAGRRLDSRADSRELPAPDLRRHPGGTPLRPCAKITSAGSGRIANRRVVLASKQEEERQSPC